MKKMKKIFALLIAMVMVLGMSTAVFAQTVGTATTGTGSITISNASKGETYAVYKLFDASVTGTEDGSVRYTGTIPESLSTYFTADSAGNISATAAAKTSDGSLTEAAITALTSWADNQTATASVTSDGTELTFAGLAYGYYVVTTTQGDTAISVDTTNPNASIIDKNTTPPVNQLTKTVDSDDEVVSIGDTVTYTVTFKTANYDGEDQIDKYVIEDTLPSFLSNVTVDSLKIIEVEADEDKGIEEQSTTLTVTAFTNKKIEIAWAQDGQNLYKNGSTIQLVYSAKVTSDVAAGNVETNANMKFKSNTTRR